VGQDRRAEQRIVGLACGLECEQQGVSGAVGLAGVEELDASGEEVRLGQCGGDRSAGVSDGFGEQGAAEAGVGLHRGVQGGGSN
jgi:hypothetical protein